MPSTEKEHQNDQMKNTKQMFTKIKNLVSSTEKVSYKYLRDS